MEERYIKITSCNGCEFVGHRIDTDKSVRVNFCVNPINLNVSAIALFKYNNKYYPVTSKTESFADSPIPTWCKLPSDIDVTQPEEMEL